MGPIVQLFRNGASFTGWTYRCEGDPAGQARRCLEIIKDALERAGASLDQVVRTRTLLTRIEDWQAVAAVPRFFGRIRPANDHADLPVH